jgi:hypothetical protein
LPVIALAVEAGLSSSWVDRFWIRSSPLSFDALMVVSSLLDVWIVLTRSSIVRDKVREPPTSSRRCHDGFFDGAKPVTDDGRGGPGAGQVDP